MASYNKVILIGNLTRDVEMRYTPKGTAVASFGMAMNHKWKTESGETKEEVTFVDCDCFGRTAEVVQQYAGTKGSPLMVEGRLKLDQWDDKQSGQKRSKLKVVIESVQLLGQKSDRGTSPAPAARPPASSAPTGAPLAGDGPPPEEDDVPF